MVEPTGCICPTQSYNCSAELVTGVHWNNNLLSDPLSYNIYRVLIQKEVGYKLLSPRRELIEIQLALLPISSSLMFLNGMEALLPAKDIQSLIMTLL